MTKEALASKIRLGREQNGLSQNELASKLGISQGTVSNWETGKAQPDAGQLKRLKSILGPEIFSEQWTPGVLEGPSIVGAWLSKARQKRSEEHTSELQSLAYLVCRLLLEKKKTTPPLQPHT